MSPAILAMMPTNLLEVVSELARAVSGIRSWQQVAGLAMIVGGGVYLFADHQPTQFDGRFNREQQALIVKTKERLGAEAIVIHQLDAGTLHPVYSSSTAVVGKEVFEGYYYGPFKALRFGNCFRSEGFAKTTESVGLGVIGCPIFRNGELVGSVSAAYYELPLKNMSVDEDVNDPTGAVLFILGAEID